MKPRYVSSLLLAASLSASAQTKVDLANQSRNVDFSRAPFVRPFPLGTALPATCQVGQMFFLTTAPAGINECASTNLWTPIQATSATAVAPIGVEWSSSTVLTIGPACSLLTPCLFRIGSSVYSLLAPATVTVTSGAGLATIYIDTNANLTVGVSTLSTPAVTCNGCIVVAGITQFPLDTIPIEVWNATNGAWDPSGTSNAAILSVPPALLAGSNVTLTETAGTITISAGAAGSSGGSGSGSGSGSGGSTGTTSFNPTDPTQFFRDHLTLDTGFTQGTDGWTYSGGCGNGVGSGVTGFSRESILSAVWGQAASGSTCLFSFPSAQNGVYGGASYDYWSGTSPAQLYVSATYATIDANATHYVGLSPSPNNTTDFIGCRQAGAGDWLAVIRAAGVDVASADTGIPHDNLTHRLVVDNAGGTANTIRCSVDGANTAIASGAVPAEQFGWFFLFGATATGTPAANFAPFQYTIFLQGLPRL